jgi:hypothetical protein
MKIKYKRCFWYFITRHGKSFDTPGIEQKCHYCNGYRKPCKQYRESEKSDISKLIAKGC